MAGSVIGSGIFLVPGAIALHLASVRAVLLIWIVGGVLSIFGALSLAEMAALYPAAAVFTPIFVRLMASALPFFTVGVF